MPKLKVLSEGDVVKIFNDFDFAIDNQKGSHVKLKRKIEDNFEQALTIPLHKELDKGTLKAIYNQALRYIPEGGLRVCFYSE